MLDCGFIPLYGAIYYSGSYRLDGTKIIFRSDKVRYEGSTIFDEFDLMWSEGKAETEGVKNFQLTPKWKRRRYLANRDRTHAQSQESRQYRHYDCRQSALETQIYAGKSRH